MKLKFPSKSKILKSLTTILTVYLTLGILLFILQKSFIYYPTNQDFKNCEGFSDYQKKSANGTRFYLKEQNKDRVIVYYHGNYGSACDRSALKSVFETTGDSIIFVEYSGYSNDERSPSKELILQDVENTVRYLNDENYKTITAYGQSIGSAAASYQAKISEVEKLILVSTFPKLSDVALQRYPIYPVSLFMTENFNNLEALEEFQGELFLIHGQDDRIISPKLSKRLFDKLKVTGKKYILIKDHGHNDLWNSLEFLDNLREIITK